jgi:single-strand DNA-binding protein
MNKWIGIGRLTKNPELKYTAGSNIPVTTFTLAVDRNFKNKDGQREADFINCVAWKKLAEIVSNNLTKGRLIAVAGKIQTRTYEGNDGKKKYITEIVAEDVQFLDYKKDAQQPASGDTSNTGTPKNDDFFPASGDYDLPF